MDLLVSLYPYGRWESTTSITRAARRMNGPSFHRMSFADHVALPSGETAKQIDDIHASMGSDGDLTVRSLETLSAYASAGITQMLPIFADAYTANLEWLAADASRR
jgi:hypothetical protein